VGKREDFFERENYRSRKKNSLGAWQIHPAKGVLPSSYQSHGGKKKRGKNLSQKKKKRGYGTGPPKGEKKIREMRKRTGGGFALSKKNRTCRSIEEGDKNS